MWKTRIKCHCQVEQEKTQTQNAAKHNKTCFASNDNAIIRKSMTKHSHKSLHSTKHKDTCITSNDNAIVRKGQGSCEAACSSEDPDVKHLKSFFCNLHVLPATNYQQMWCCCKKRNLVWPFSHWGCEWEERSGWCSRQLPSFGPCVSCFALFRRFLI